MEPTTSHAAGWVLAVPSDERPGVTGSIDPTLLDDLVWRGMIAHATDLGALREALTGGSVRFYVGFDPTAPSLHMGNLLQLVTARRLQDAGHTPFILVGGATGMIGDPRESAERALNSLDTVKDWSERVRRQVEPFVGFEGSNAATIVNNYDWTASLSTIDFLREIGKHFPVNRMLQRDVVARRLESGISYTEFSYVLLQSMDFLNLYRDHGVTLQHGATDQWGNITAGVDLIRRTDGGQAHAFVTPLITKPDGTKYGKTEEGALWLDPEMMSPYAFHQFWLNVDDAQVGGMLRAFTFLRHEEIEALEAETAEKPWLRSGQRRLADEVTSLVHGDAETQQREGCRRGALRWWRSPRPEHHDAGRGAARGRVDVGARARPGGRPAGRVGARQEQGRGPADHLRRWCVPQQRPRRGPRGPSHAGGSDRWVLARAAAWQEAVRGRRGRLRWTSSRHRSRPVPGSSCSWSRRADRSLPRCGPTCRRVPARG